MVGWVSRTIVGATVRMPKWFVRWVSRRYVAGPDLSDAVAIMKRLSGEGTCFTFRCFMEIFHRSFDNSSGSENHIRFRVHNHHLDTSSGIPVRNHLP